MKQKHNQKKKRREAMKHLFSSSQAGSGVIHSTAQQAASAASTPLPIMKLRVADSSLRERYVSCNDLSRDIRGGGNIGIC